MQNVDLAPWQRKDQGRNAQDEKGKVVDKDRGTTAFSNTTKESKADKEGDSKVCIRQEKLRTRQPRQSQIPET